METEYKEPNQSTQPGLLPGPGQNLPSDTPIQQVEIDSSDVRAGVQDVDYIEEDVQSRVPKPLVSLKGCGSCFCLE